tara:strand:+ start:644 stop:1153 length:510 start_codon:yes stop_codon:yes gene_type:complete
MKKALLAFGMILVTASTASAGGMVTKHASSVQLTVDAARTTATRIGNSYSVSGSGVVTDVGGTGTADLNVGGLGTISNGAAAGSFATATQATSGDAFSFSNSFTAGDAVITSAPSTGAVSAFSNQTSYAAGAAGSLAGTIDNAHTMTLTAGDPGSSATGQFITEVTIID